MNKVLKAEEQKSRGQEDKQETCHAELVSASHVKVDSQHEHEIPEQVQNDMNGKLLVPQYLSALVPLKKAAFTLAEVLITLGIIGIVAAMTLPVLKNKIENRQNIVKLKKVYSELSQAKQLLDYEYGGSFTSACATFDDTCMRDLFAQKLKVIELCHSSVPNKCQELSYWEKDSDAYNGVDSLNANFPALLTESGYSLKFRFHTNECTQFINAGRAIQACGWIQVDTNGKSRPNQAGKDVFYILIFKDRLVPKDLNSSCESMEKCENINF